MASTRIDDKQLGFAFTIRNGLAVVMVVDFAVVPTRVGCSENMAKTRPRPNRCHFGMIVAVRLRQGNHSDVGEMWFQVVIDVVGQNLFMLVNELICSSSFGT